MTGDDAEDRLDDATLDTDILRLGQNLIDDIE